MTSSQDYHTAQIAPYQGKQALFLHTFLRFLLQSMLLNAYNHHE